MVGFLEQGHAGVVQALMLSHPLQDHGEYDTSVAEWMWPVVPYISYGRSYKLQRDASQQDTVIQWWLDCKYNRYRASPMLAEACGAVQGIAREPLASVPPRRLQR